MSSRKERVRGFITSMFLTDAAASLGDDDSLLQLQIVDSTGFLELVGFLESEFGIKVDDDEMLPENLDTLGCIDAFLARKLGAEGERLSMATLPPLDYAAEADRISEALRTATRQLRRRGLVVAMSGGIDSSVSAALAVRALGAGHVYGLLLPERDSTLGDGSLGALLARHLGMRFERQEISPALAALGCYESQQQVLRRVVPGYGEGWKFKLAISSAMGGHVSVTRVVAEDPQGRRHEARLAAPDYQQLVAATNFKQRVRKVLEYYHADRLHYAVVGTPNRLEYDQGFFVKLGDGAADVKPIAHLYKTQVYGMARYLGLPEAITSTTPTTDTFSLAQGQDEFYFGLPYAQMDLVLWHLNEGLPATALAAALGCTEAAAEAQFAAVHAKRRTTAYLHAAPLLAGEIPGIPVPL